MFKLLDRASKIDGMEPKGEVPSGPTALEAGTIEFDQATLDCLRGHFVFFCSVLQFFLFF